MEANFWLDSWSNGLSPWNQAVPNKTLKKNFGEITTHTDNPTLFFPLCGKTIDMKFAYEKGLEVIGNDISDIALRDFFLEFKIPYKVEGNLYKSEDNKIRLYHANLFQSPKELIKDLSNTTSIFDRGSLIALGPRDRKKYYNVLNEFIPSNAVSLVEGINYNPCEFSPPPHNVGINEVREGFGKFWSINIKEHFSEVAELRGNSVEVERWTLILKKRQ